MQNRHNDFCCRSSFLLVDIDRNASAIVPNGDGFIRMDGHGDIFAIARQSLIDSVINYFENHVMQARSIIGVTDIHTGTLSNGIQSFEDFDR